MKAFFFAPESPRPLALVRLVLGFVLLCDTVFHWRYAVELYSTFGPAMPIFLQQGEADSKSPSSSDLAAPKRILQAKALFPRLIPPPRLALGAHTLLIFAFASVMVGWRTCTSLATAFLLTLWLAPLDVPGTFGKHYVIAIHMLLLLGFSCCGWAWSIDALPARHMANRGRVDYCRLSCACPRRLIQILVCTVYAGAAITKIKTPSFVNGDLLTFSLLDDHWGGGRFAMWLTTVRHVPLLLSHATIAFEILFPVLVWVPRCRLPMLAAAILVHSCMACLLNLGPFSPIMFAALLSFLDERELARLARLVDVFFRRTKVHGETDGAVASLADRQSEAADAIDSDTNRRVPKKPASRLLHLVAVALFVTCGYLVQYFADWYGVFSRRPPEPLAEIAAADFSEMLSRQSPAYEDYFHSIELGSRFGGNQVFGSSTKFHVGQRAYVLTQMPMPHPAVTLEGLLITPTSPDGVAGREVARFTHRLDSAFSYSINGFELTPELPLGIYRIILQAEGFVIAERRFELVATP